MELREKKEVIVECFKNTFNKKTAYKKASVTPEEWDLLDKDSEFQQRLQYFLILEQEKVVNKMKTFLESKDEKISFKATLEFGKLVFPDFFIAKEGDDNIPVTADDVQEFFDNELKS